MTWTAVRLAFSRGFPLSLAAALVLLPSCGTAGLGLDSIGADASQDGFVIQRTDGGIHRGEGGSGSDATMSLSSDSGTSGGQCVPLTCSELGVNCGPMGDGCGGVVQCGTCKAPATCGGGGKASTCGGNNNCVPKVCSDVGANCGPVGDGCGGVVQCGSCSAPETCGGGGTASSCGGNSGCVPTTCAIAKVDCGPIGDGCGGVLQCGSCGTPETCGGGGKSSVCGDGLVDSGDTGSKCTPKTCLQLGINCGPAGDGCGNQLSCGNCSAPETCGGGGKASVCGGTSGCTPKTCVQLGVNCGPAGDGCGGELSCGTCTAPQTCGGGGTPGACGGSNDCVPKTCAQLGMNCGPAGDGCGGLLECGSTCPAGEICGGGGAPGVCGPTTGTTTCTNLCLKQTTCPSGGTTSVTGTVFAPNGGDPLYNALVYIPNAPVAAFVPGVACEQCTASVSGSPLVSTNTAPDGTFELRNVPVGSNIPLVIQLGRWRRQVVIPTVAACTNTPVSTGCSAATALSGACLTSMPTSHLQGDIPLMAFVTGAVDTLECVFRKIGIVDSEFGNPGSTNGLPRLQLYKGDGPGSVTAGAGAQISSATPSETQLWGTQAALNAYDLVIYACQGEAIAQTAQQTLVNYANAGGRVFATHYNYTWLNTSPAGTWVNPFIATATWDPADSRNFSSDPGTGIINTSFVDGQALAQWLEVVGASTTYGQIAVNTLREDFTSVASASSTLWVHVQDATLGNVPLHYTFDTPVGTPAANQCGRVDFEDYHVENSGGIGGDTFPMECPAGAMTPQEKLLEFELFDLSSCIAPRVPPPPPTCTAENCTQQGFNCGPAGDGCGNQLNCGACTLPQTCGGGGMPGVCGGTACAPVSCTTQGIQCGPTGDGCGNLLQCGNCPNGTTCGGGGQPGKCGKPSCTTETCAAQSIQCGPAGDGCGGLLECGNCPVGEACGGNGQPGKCGAPDASACAPLTCTAQGIACGPAGDGCGGQLACGTCPNGETCGGGGTPGVCGAPQCTPTTCTALGFTCGPAGDGCGGLLDCGSCPANETCGGGGKPGVCGSSCVPATCSSLKFNCGPAGDGCGGLLQCGACMAPDTCGGGGVAGQCGNSGPK